MPEIVLHVTFTLKEGKTEEDIKKTWTYIQEQMGPKIKKEEKTISYIASKTEDGKTMYFNEIYANVEGFKFHMGNFPEEGLKPIVENYDADIVMHVSEEEKEEMSKALAAMKPKTAVVGFSKTK